MRINWQISKEVVLEFIGFFNEKNQACLKWKFISLSIDPHDLQTGILKL